MSATKGTIAFALKLPPRLRDAGLPIEVRSSDRRLIGRFDGKQPIAVEAGAYFVSLRLPSGDELTDWVEVAAGATVTASLAADVAAAADDDGDDDDDAASRLIIRPSLKHARSHEAAHADALAPGAAPSVQLAVRAWSGTIGDYQPLPPAAFEVERRRGQARVTVRSSPRDQTLVQLASPRRPGLIIVLPARPHGPDTSVVITHGRGAASIDAHLENALADVIIRDTTEVARTKRIGETMTLRGLLADKISDPIAAAAGAVALLAVDQAEQVHAWLENLATMFPWLPDGACLAAESAARRGDHAAAVHHLLTLSTRGIPLFSDALSYALDRLSRYERDRGEPRADRTVLQSLRRRLQPFAEFRLPGRPLTTFRALTPDTPSDDAFDYQRPAGAVPI